MNSSNGRATLLLAAAAVLVVLGFFANLGTVATAVALLAGVACASAGIALLRPDGR